MRAAAAGTAPREAFVRARGVDVFVRERGDGRPLLMVNGIGGSVDTWLPAEERLAQVARTIVFDSPGTGRSPTELWPLTVSSLAKLAAELLDELRSEERRVGKGCRTGGPAYRAKE